MATQAYSSSFELLETESVRYERDRAIIQIEMAKQEIDSLKDTIRSVEEANGSQLSRLREIYLSEIDSLKNLVQNNKITYEIREIDLLQKVESLLNEYRQYKNKAEYERTRTIDDVLECNSLRTSLSEMLAISREKNQLLHDNTLMRSKIMQLEGAIVDQSSELSKYKEELAAADVAVNSLRMTITDHVVRHHQMQSVNDEHKNENAQRQSRLVALEATIEDLELTLKRLQSERLKGKEDFEAEREDFTSKIASLKSENEDLKHEPLRIQKLQESNTRLQNEMSELKRIITLKEQEYRAQISNADRQYRALELESTAKHTASESEIAQLTAEKEKLAADMKREHDAHLADLQHNHTQSKMRNVLLLMRRDEKDKNFETTIDELSKKITKLQSELEEKDSNHYLNVREMVAQVESIWQKKVDVHANEVKESQTSSAQTSERVQERFDRLVELHSVEMTEMKRLVAEVEGRNNFAMEVAIDKHRIELEALDAKYRALASSSSLVESNLMNKLENFSRQDVEYKTKIDALKDNQQTELSGYKQQLGELQNKLDDQRPAVDRYEATISALKQDNDNLHKELLFTQKSYNEQLSKLTRKTF